MPKLQRPMDLNPKTHYRHMMSEKNSLRRRREVIEKAIIEFDRAFNDARFSAILYSDGSLGIKTVAQLAVVIDTKLRDRDILNNQDLSVYMDSIFDNIMQLLDNASSAAQDAAINNRGFIIEFSLE